MSKIKSMPKRIAIIGDSTAFWMRPCNTHGKTYSEILSGSSHLKVDLYLRPGNMFAFAMEEIWLKISPKRYDVYVIALGINDICPRTVTTKFAKKHSPAFPAFGWWQKLNKLIYRCLTNNHLQRLSAILLISRPWYNLKSIDSMISFIVRILMKEKNCHIIFINIPRTSDRIERIFPEIQFSIKKFNEVLSKKADLTKNVKVLDVYDLFHNDELKLVPEGIHFSQEGHKKVANALSSLMMSIS